MAIRFDGTNGEWATATTGWMPTFTGGGSTNSLSLFFVAKITALLPRQQTFVVLERPAGNLGLWVGVQAGYLRVYTYSGAMVCQIGSVVAGNYYGVGLVLSGYRSWNATDAIRCTMQQILNGYSPLIQAQGAYPSSSYQGAQATRIKFGESSYNEPLNGTIENIQLLQTDISNVSHRGFFESHPPPDPNLSTRHWWVTAGPTVTQAVVDYMGDGNLTLTGTLAYEAGFTAPVPVTYNETLDESVSLTDTWDNEHIAIRATQDNMSETVTATDSYATKLIARSAIQETVTLTDTWRVSLRTPSPLLEAHYSGPGTAALSLGGTKSTVQVRQGLFGRLTQAQWAAGGSYYRCIYLTISGDRDDVGVYVKSQTTSSMTDVAIGWGAPINTLEPAITTEQSGPPSVSFYPAASQAEAIIGGDFLADQWRALWIRFRITGTDIILDDDFALRVVST